MAPSSLKKMSRSRGRKEGNHASSDQSSSGGFTGCDLGLTLLPGPQIQQQDEEEPKPPAKGSLERPLGKRSVFLKQADPSPSGRKDKRIVKDVSLSNNSHLANNSNRSDITPNAGDPLRGQSRQDDTEVMPQELDTVARYTGNARCIHSSSSADQGLKDIGTKHATGVQHHDWSYPPKKRRKVGIPVSFLPLNLVASQDKEHFSEINPLRSCIKSVCKDGVQLRDSVRQPGQAFPVPTILNASSIPSKPSLIECPDNVSISNTHQRLAYEEIFVDTGINTSNSLIDDTNLADCRFRGNARLRSATKYERANGTNSTACEKPHDSSHSSSQASAVMLLSCDSPKQSCRKVLKPKKHVKKSWTSYFPTSLKTRISRRHAISHAPSSQETPFILSNPSDQHTQHLDTLSVSFKSCDEHLHVLKKDSAPSFGQWLRSSDHSSNTSLLVDIASSTISGVQCHITPIRSASLPIIHRTRLASIMDSPHNRWPTGLPTPPNEKQILNSGRDISNPSFAQHSNIFVNYMPGSSNHTNTLMNATNPRARSVPAYANNPIRPGTSPSNVPMAYSNTSQQILGSVGHQSPTGRPLQMAAALQQCQGSAIELKSSHSPEEVHQLVEKYSRSLLEKNKALIESYTTLRGEFYKLRQEKVKITQLLEQYEYGLRHQDQMIKAMKQADASKMREIEILKSQNDHLNSAMQRHAAQPRPTKMIAENILRTLSPAVMAEPSLEIPPGEVPNTGAVIPPEQVLIDLTDEISFPPLSNLSPSTTHETPVQNQCPMAQVPLVQHPPGQFPLPSQAQPHQGTTSHNPHSEHPADQMLQNSQPLTKAWKNFGQKSLDWYDGVRPGRRMDSNQKQFGLPSATQPSKAHSISPTQLPHPDSQAPLPGAKVGRKSKKEPRMTKEALDPLEKIRRDKEKRKGYRKTYAEKKKREKEIEMQSGQVSEASGGTTRLMNRGRRAAKEEKRQQQIRQSSAEVQRQVSLKRTLDGRLHEGHNRALQASTTQVTSPLMSDDIDSLFADSDMEVDSNMEDLESSNSENSPSSPPAFGGDGQDVTVQEPSFSSDADYDGNAAMEAEMVASMEAELEAAVDAGEMKGFIANAVAGVPGEESEESEEE
ncbi:hypothetical protein MMC28_005327 [Mycoblastus sanguinarius]|nr:hypothetical protein [Mycoblastus sanguinarius]